MRGCYHPEAWKGKRWSVVIRALREPEPWRRVPSWSCNYGRMWPWQNLNAEWGQGEKRGRNALTALSYGPLVFVLVPRLLNLIRSQQGKEFIMWLHSDPEDVTGRVLWAFLEKLDFSDKRGQAWMAVYLILPSLPYLNEDMIVRGQQSSSNHEATAWRW